MKKTEFPLPAYRHLPGQNARPNDGLLESIASKATPLLLTSNAANNKAWCYAVHLVNEAYYWEAHEVLEAFWNCAKPNSRERALIQCLIQLSNARLKMVLGQPKAAKRLKQLTTDCYKRAFGFHTEPLMGIKPSELTAAIELCDSVTDLPRFTVLEKQHD